MDEDNLIQNRIPKMFISPICYPNSHLCLSFLIFLTSTHLLLALSPLNASLCSLNIDSVLFKSYFTDKKQTSEPHISQLLAGDGPSFLSSILAPHKEDLAMAWPLT